MFITKHVIIPSDRSARHGCDDRAAVPRLDGACLDCPGQDGRSAGAPLRRSLRAAGGEAWILGTDHGRQQLRVLAHSEAARVLSRFVDDRVRPLHPSRRPCPHGGSVVDRQPCQEDHRGGCPARDVDRSDAREADRAGDRAALDRGGDRRFHRLHRGMRHPVCLRLHEHHLVAHTHDAAADGDQPAHSLRTDVRTSRNECAAGRTHAEEPEHSRLGQGRRDRARGRPGGSRPHPPQRVPAERA